MLCAGMTLNIPDEKKITQTSWLELRMIYDCNFRKLRNLRPNTGYESTRPSCRSWLGVKNVNSKEQEYAKDIGKQLNGKIICPRCRMDGWPDSEQQTLSTYGDFEDILFCPHCELDLNLEIRNL